MSIGMDDGSLGSEGISCDAGVNVGMQVKGSRLVSSFRIWLESSKLVVQD